MKKLKALKNLNKKQRIMASVIVGVVLVAVLIFLLIGFGTGAKEQSLEHRLEQAYKYMEEMDYQSAIVAFQDVLKIDPKNEEVYLGLADAYIMLEDYENAMTILETGFAETNSELLSNRLDEIQVSYLQLSQDVGSSSDGENSQDDEMQDQSDQGNNGNASDEDGERSPGFVRWEDAGLKDHEMDWQDEALERVMRDRTGIQDRPIMLSNVWGFLQVGLSGFGIMNINALGELKNLTYLDLGSNQISDISALANLTSLTTLYLGSNQISDISALANLTSLDT